MPNFLGENIKKKEKEELIMGLQTSLISRKVAHCPDYPGNEGLPRTRNVQC